MTLMCQFLICLIEAKGEQSQDFWRRFLPTLSQRPHVDAPTSLQALCKSLLDGDGHIALKSCASDATLWPHALIISRVLAPDVYNNIVAGIRPFVQRGPTSVSVGLTDAERADPAVHALLYLYDVLSNSARGSLEDWPVHIALAASVLLPAEPELFTRMVEEVAETLAGRGDTFGAHLCYLLTGKQPDSVDAPSSVIAVIGVEHRDPGNFGSLLDPLALQLTEVYEYALRCGDPQALCPSIQPFKLVYAQILADAGLLDQARKYMALLQAFVKAMPQKKLSDAFRLGMREFTEQLKLQSSGADTNGMGQMVSNIWGTSKGLFRGIAETTGLAVKPTPAPALDGQMQPTPPGQFPVSSPPPLSSSFSNPAQRPPLGSPSAPLSGPTPSPPPLSNPMSSPPQGVSAPLISPPTSAPAQDAPLPNQASFQNALESDPLVSAGKAAWTGLTTRLFGGSEAPKPKEVKETGFYYDETLGRWREKGKEGLEEDPSQYDPMTGKRLTVTSVDAPPGPMMPPSEPPSGPPMGPLTGSPSSLTSLRRGGSTLGSLYVNPGSTAPPPQVSQACTSPCATQPFSTGAAAYSPTAAQSPFGMGVQATSPTAAQSPFGMGVQQTPFGGVPQTPFGR